jgi:hypothetical protein
MIQTQTKHSGTSQVHCKKIIHSSFLEEQIVRSTSASLKGFTTTKTECKE